MKILCLIDGLGPGGAQRQMVGLANLLKDKEYRILVVYYHDKHFFREFLVKNNIEFQHITNAKNKWMKFRKINAVVKEFQPDVLISYLEGSNMLACLIRIFGGKFKLIVSERGMTHALSIKKRFKFFLYRWSDKVVPNSYTEKQYIEEHFERLRNKLCTITNFVDTNFFSPANVLQKDTTDVLKILCVASIWPVKNILLFLKAISELVHRGVSLQVKWYGNILSESYYNTCIEMCKNLNLSEIVYFNKASEHIREEYRQADVFCLPSLSEGFPNVICEAMSCGLPILCSNVSDNSQIVEDGITGFLFNPQSVENMSEAFFRFIHLSPENKHKMRENARRLAFEKFSSEHFVQEYMKVINP